MAKSKRNGTVLFDLDGTVADTSQDIYRSFNKTLRMFNIQDVQYEVVLEYIGDGMRPLIKKILAQLMRKDEEEIIFRGFIDEYRRNISKKTYIYSGVIELIFELRARGIESILVTNKFEDLTVKLLSELCVPNLFDGIVCGDTFDVRKPSKELLEKIRTRYSISEPVFVVGDGLNDFLFARNAGLYFILSKWGFPTTRVSEYIRENNIDVTGCFIRCSYKPSDVLKAISEVIPDL